MKLDLKKQCDPKFRVERTHSSKVIGLQKPVHQKPEVFNRFRIFSKGSIGTSKLACMSILKWIGPFLNPEDKNVFSEMSLWAAISKNQFFSPISDLFGLDEDEVAERSYFRFRVDRMKNEPVTGRQSVQIFAKFEKCLQKSNFLTKPVRLLTKCA